MSIGGPTFQDGFADAQLGVSRYTRGDSPIARAFRGITHNGNSVTAHIEHNSVWYSFDLDGIEIRDDGSFVVSAETINGPEIITLSHEAIDYIKVRYEDGNYPETMSLSGYEGGHYGHIPYVAKD